MDRDVGLRSCHGQAMALTELLTNDRFSSSVIRDLLVHARQPNVISLAGGLPAEAALPVERVKVGLDRVLQQSGAAALQYGLTTGEPVLQELIAAAASHQTEPDQIIITAGSQQALDLALRALAHPDPTQNIVAVEDPGYLGAIQAMRANGYTLAAIPVDKDGMVVEDLAARLQAGLRPRVCYVNPAFQNPTGACLTPDRAIRLVELAEQYNFVVLADDPYVELYLDGDRPTPLPQSDMVAYLGSMSKTLSPGLRVGWLQAAPELVTAVALAKQPADLQTATINQLLVADLLMDTTWWSKHTDALRSDYRNRRAALRAAMAKYLPKATVQDQHGGFFLWANVEPDEQSSSLDLMELLPRAVEHGVAFVPGDAFTVDSTLRTTLRLSYSSGDPAQFGEAIRRLAIAVERR